MSASLVGSEMCIRDRLPTRPMWAARSAPKAESHRLAQEKNTDRAPIRACLLYTSDAADDM
eukprot:2239527-Alexandrium_andersonii.AAC.1